MVRAKVTLKSITDYGNDYNGFVFEAVCDDSTEENKKFSKYTPSGKFEMSCTNTAASRQFEVGESYYVDFTKVIGE